jgi:hypothetical protein
MENYFEIEGVPGRILPTTFNEFEMFSVAKNYLNS